MHWSDTQRECTECLCCVCIMCLGDVDWEMTVYDVFLRVFCILSEKFLSGIVIIRHTQLVCIQSCLLWCFYLLSRCEMLCWLSLSYPFVHFRFCSHDIWCQNVCIFVLFCAVFRIVLSFVFACMSVRSLQLRTVSDSEIIVCIFKCVWWCEKCGTAQCTVYPHLFFHLTLTKVVYHSRER